MDFNTYLKSKKIDPAAFEVKQPLRYSEWAELYAHVHPDSFTMQKKFLINGIRRQFPLPKEV